MPMRWLVLSLVLAVALAGGAVAWRRALFRLVGPVFLFDLVRLSRRGRFLLLRVGYATFLLILLSIAYHDWAERFARVPVGWFHTVAVPLERMPELAAAAFAGFMTAQFLAVFLITPVYTAGAIAEEKDRGTLELLFACGLTSREIVLGKLMSRLAHVMVLILAGLPIIVFLPFWGGVDPNLVIAGFLMTAVTAISLGSVGLRLSITAARPFDAALATYGIAFCYMLISPCIPGLNTWVRLGGVFTNSQPPNSILELAILVLVYCGTHLLVALACILSSIRTVRRACLHAETGRYDALGLRRAPPNFFHPRPRLPRRPIKLVIWKERNVEPNLLHSHPLLMGCLAMVFLWAGMSFALFLLTEVVRGLSGGNTNPVFRPIVMIFAAVPLLLVALGTAGRISRERERRTLDSLLTTALDWSDILMGKALAGVIGVSFVLGTLGYVAILGLLSGGINVATFPLLILAESTYVAFAAMLGLYVSAISGNTVRSMIITALVILGLSIIPLLLGPAAMLSPPMGIWKLSVGYDYTVEKIPEILAAFWVPWVFYGGSTLVLWKWTRTALEG
jgi:ABC-type transport system involved in multi-copper enzyme maturation permease subunit